MKYFNTTKEQVKQIKQFIKDFNNKVGRDYIKGYRIKFEHDGDVLYFKRQLSSFYPEIKFCYFGPISNVFSCNLLEKALQKIEV